MPITTINFIFQLFNEKREELAIAAIWMAVLHAHGRKSYAWLIYWLSIEKLKHHR